MKTEGKVSSGCARYRRATHSGKHFFTFSFSSATSTYVRLPPFIICSLFRAPKYPYFSISQVRFLVPSDAKLPYLLQKSQLETVQHARYKTKNKKRNLNTALSPRLFFFSVPSFFWVGFWSRFLYIIPFICVFIAWGSLRFFGLLDFLIFAYSWASETRLRVFLLYYVFVGFFFASCRRTIVRCLLVRIGWRGGPLKFPKRFGFQLRAQLNLFIARNAFSLSLPSFFSFFPHFWAYVVTLPFFLYVLVFVFCSRTGVAKYLRLPPNVCNTAPLDELSFYRPRRHRRALVSYSDVL